MPPTPQHVSSPLAEAAQARTTSLATTHTLQQRQSSKETPPPNVEAEKDPYVSKIGILASSIPYYHSQYMAQVAADKRKKHMAQDDGEAMEPHEAAYFSKLAISNDPPEQSSEEQEATAKRLKPHSRSTIQLQYITSQPPKKPDENAQNQYKKHRPRWQFGIRSRNLPHEAMHCVYKALAAQNAEWEIPKPQARGPDTAPAPYPSRRKEERDEDVDPNIMPENYIPKDPWCIKVRWRKDGMLPPGTIHPNSAHSSHIDLSTQETRRLSTATISTQSGSAAQLVGADGACYVYMDVQLYTLEPNTDKQQGTYLVDFKCAGYEAIVEQVMNETEKVLVGNGHRVNAKDVTSPQPFLDLTNKLVIHLAGGG